MKLVVQRSGSSSVWVEGELKAEIEQGLVVLVGLENGDTPEIVKAAAERVVSLRIFEDPKSGKMAKSLIDTKGELLAISQFTLAWDGKKGLRPSFDGALAPSEARIYFRLFCDHAREHVPVKTGVFGAHMDVRIQNLGPVTFHLSF